MRYALALLAVGLAGACATSGPDNEHGPTFLDGGGDGASAGDVGATGDDAVNEGATADDATNDGPSSVDAPAEAQGDATADGSTDAGGGDTGQVDSGSCTSTMALLAASGTVMGEAVFGHGQWSTASTVAGGAAGAPSLVAFGAGYLGVYVGAGTTGSLPLRWTAYTGSWTPPATIGAALAQGKPALAVIAGTAHLVYWGSDGKFYHGTYGGSWDAASDKVQSGGGAAQSFGPSAPVVAATGAALALAQSGQDGQLYAQPWTGSWQAAVPVAGSSVESLLTPAIVALTGGSADAMVVFVHAGDAGDYHLQYTVRTSGSWSAPVELYDQAGNIAYAGTTPSLAALPNGGAIVAWQGSSPAHPYVSTYDPAAKWSAPLPVGGAVLASPPSVVPGVCGAQAAMAYVQATGEVDVTTLSGGSWGTPVAIAGASGMQTVALASLP
ncbi:MAG TPA: hypothetical protein VIF15_04695 [Polyangiaceae bacterium]